MSATTKLVVAFGIAFVIGGASLFAMQHMSLKLVDQIDQGYRKVFVEVPDMTRTGSPALWAASAKLAIVEVEADADQRKMAAMFAVPGSRNEIATLKQDFDHMIELRKAQVASVEKKLAEAKPADEAWIARLPVDMQQQVRSASQMVGWARDNAETLAELEPMTQEFERTVSAVRAKVAGFWHFGSGPQAEAATDKTAAVAGQNTGALAQPR